MVMVITKLSQALHPRPETFGRASKIRAQNRKIPPHRPL